MDDATARALCALNNEFYRAQAESFSATRENPWPGWARVLDRVCTLEPGGFGESGGCAAGSSREASTGQGAGAPDSLRILDVACGNLRFERFLAAERPGRFSVVAADSCDEMALDALPRIESGKIEVDFRHLDAMEGLLGGTGAGRALSAVCAYGPASVDVACSFDAAVCFGFMHHIPGEGNRLCFLRDLAEAVRPGGIVALSLWRFMDDERLARKARAITEGFEATESIDVDRFEPGDYLLGWKDSPGALRYCHHFGDDEVARIASAVSDVLTLADRFSSDGKSGRLNEYLIFERI